MLSRSASAAARLAGKAGRRSYIAPPARDMKFLYELHDFDTHYTKLEHRTPCDKETAEMVIDASGKLCEDLAPLNLVADKEGCTWVDMNTVTTPTGFKGLYDQYVGDGWQALSYPEEYGGQGLPNSLALIQSEMLATANFAFLMFPGLSKGCINTILAHATDELKQTWLPPLIDGRFTGTMCLTEPQCGSDLGQCIVKAEPRDDGSYSITGTKIFISCGEVRGAPLARLASRSFHCTTTSALNIFASAVAKSPALLPMMPLLPTLRCPPDRNSPRDRSTTSPRTLCTACLLGCLTRLPAPRASRSSSCRSAR